MTLKKQASPVIRKCYECAGQMEGRRENYRYTECGLSSVTLLDVLVFHCKCGAIVPEIRGAGSIHERLMFDLLKKNTLLSAEEIRFLRKMAGYTATKLAGTMGVAKETVSRWENDHQPIGGESDRLLRFACLFNFLLRREPDRTGDVEHMFDFVKHMSTLNLPEILQRVEDQAKGPKQIRINPEMLSQFGAGGGDPPALAGETVQ